MRELLYLAADSSVEGVSVTLSISKRLLQGIFPFCSTEGPPLWVQGNY